jgi:hypothetical protein
MSTKRDPILSVIQFFETADLAVAQAALELAKQKVRLRGPLGGRLAIRATPTVAKSKPKSKGNAKPVEAAADH